MPARPRQSKTAELFGIFTRVASAFQGVPPDAHARVWTELRPWFANLAENATGKWLHRLAVGVTCEIPIVRAGKPVGPCPGSAIAACQACSKLCCLKHAKIDEYGDALCFPCCAEIIGSKQKRRATAAAHGVPADDLGWAYDLLKVKAGAPFAKVKAAYKKACADHHPDRFARASVFEKENAEAQFKRVQLAWQALKVEYPDES